MRCGIIALSITAVITLLIASVVYVPVTDADDTEYGTGNYGATYEFDTQKIDDAIKSVTGRSISEWVEYFSDKSEYYSYSLDKSDAISKFAITRDTEQDGDEYTIYDHLSGYVKVRFDADASGPFPEEGVYYPEEEESLIQFIKRLLVEERSSYTRDVGLHFDIQLYLDLDIVTHADLSTGAIKDSYIKFRAALYDLEDHNVHFHVETDEEFDPMYAVVDYERIKEDNNFFLDIEMGLTMEGMNIYTDKTTTWVVEPLVTEHVDKFIVSADLANSLWLQLIAGSEKDMSDSKLPKLILELIGSGGRMLDLFDTIKSLTSSEVPDITTTGTFKAENVTDTRDYNYCQMTLITVEGEDGTVFRVPKAAYTLNISDLVKIIPDYIIDDGRKQKISDILTFLGWDGIDVKDISKNTPKQDECSMVRSYVNEKIQEDDVENYQIPQDYRIIAYAGLGISGVLALAIWRRVI